MAATTVAPQRARAVAALDAVLALLAKADRPDLDTRAAASRARLDQTACTVLVVGEFKKGKSTLVNALLNAPICPVDDDVATAKPIEIHHADTPQVQLVYVDDGRGDGTPLLRSVAFEELASYASEPPTAPDADQVVSIRVGLPRQLLGTGLVLVDTPGVGGLGSTHSAATIGALPKADAVLFVTDASQELTKSEVEFLRTARALCPTTVCVMTKTDFYSSWRRIAELDREHLRREWLECPFVAVSAPLRMTAIEQNDKDMNTESGFGDLVALLRDELAARAERTSLARLGEELNQVLDHLEAQLRAEVAVLDDPEESARMVRQLESAKEQADRLRGQAARWQQTLNDGTGDLVADIEFDLRARFRDLVREAEEAVDTLDPVKAWDELEPWLGKRATEEITANYTQLHERASELAERVAGHFDTAQHDITSRLDIAALTTKDLDFGLRASLKMDRVSKATQVVGALRGTSGSMIMLTMFTGLAGIALTPLVIVGVGAMMGRKMFGDERKRQLAQRRMLAKQAIRKYTDDLAFVAGKDSRDSLRLINRQLRDFFLQKAEELSASTSESLAAAQQALRSTEQSRTQRRKVVASLLTQLGESRHAVAAVGATGA